MNGEKLPEDVSAWDWLFGGQGKASSDQEGSSGQEGSLGMEGTEGLPGKEGSSGQEGSGWEGKRKTRREEGPGFSDPWKLPGGEPQVRKDEARPEPDLQPVQWESPVVVVPGPAPAEDPTVPRYQRGISPVGAPVIRRDDRGEEHRESWRRAVAAAVILGPPKAARGRFRPW
ncbi:hypothetical protein [Kyrpidia sp.]|uniref:hypothetical protein n=1 Tax=Kyrpidia sp. TaxID=2073077 RepID=UPI00258CADAE|nr:hypothetical protein [Kyrpidia sp.]MCL6575978.1 hypothetical protein [Kyrpidia sp.]